MNEFRVRINNIPALVQIIAWHRSGGKPLYEPTMVSLLIHICVTRPQWVTLAYSSFGDKEDITRIIVIKSEVSTFPNCCHIFRVCVCWGWSYHHMPWLSYISQEKLGCVSFITVQSYDVCKWSSIVCPVFEGIGCLSYLPGTFCRVCV